MCYYKKGNSMSEIKIDWRAVEEKRKQPLTPEDLAQIRVLQEKYGFTDEEWNQMTPEHKHVSLSQKIKE